MSKLIVALIYALLAVPALAADPAPADQTPADVDMANVRAGQAASAPAATPVQGQPDQAAPAAGGAAQQTVVEQPKSAIPLDKRQGPDITKCLEAGDKSDKAINACADKYRPHGRR